jgi:hypothetical protein
MIVTLMQLTISSRRDIAVLQKESSSLEGEEDVNTNGHGAAQDAAAYRAPGRLQGIVPVQLPVATVSMTRSPSKNTEKFG